MVKVYESGAAERTMLTVHARDRQSTFFDVVAGRSYSFTATGWWVDAWIACDADGYKAWWLRGFEDRRIAPAANWLFLIALLERQPGRPIVIGSERQSWVAPLSGRLTFLANDVPSMYWNNWGRLRLEVRSELADQADLSSTTESTERKPAHSRAGSRR